jgi:hypothetical protein
VPEEGKTMNKWERRDSKRTKRKAHVRHADFTPQMNAVAKRGEKLKARDWAEIRRIKMGEG